MQNENESTNRRKRNYLKIAAAVLAAIMIYAIFGFFALPLLIRSILPEKLFAVLHRKFTIENVAVNPFALSVNVKGIRVVLPDGNIFASLDEFFIDLQISSLFKRSLIIKEIRLTKPFVDIARNADGTFNFSDLGGAAKTSETPSETKTEAPRAINFAVETLQLEAGRIAYIDSSLGTPFKTAIDPLNVTLRYLSSQPGKPAAYTISATTPEKETITGKGIFALFPFISEGNLALQKISLAKYAPYYQDYVNIAITGGSIDFQTGYRFSPDKPSKVMLLTQASLMLDSLKLQSRESREDFCVIPSLAVENTNVDIIQKTVTIGSLDSKNGFLLCKRMADGTLNLNRLTLRAPLPQNPPPREQTATTELSWKVDLNHLVLKDYTIRAEDLTPSDPVKIILDQIELEGKDLTTRVNEKNRIALALRYNQKGNVATKGTLVFSPFSASLEVNARGVDIKSVQPYFTDKVKLIVTDGDFNANGRLSFAQKPDLSAACSYQGEVSITRFASIDRKQAQDFLKWKSLHFDDLQIGYKPLKILIDKVSLTDFYSRLMINPDGTVNVRTIFSPEDQNNKPAKTDPKHPGKPDQETLPDIKINQVIFQGGTVNFSDRLARKHFETNLLELGGKISGLSSEEQSRADVFLKGKHGGSAPLEIKGKINPLIANRYADLKLTFKDIELSPFSPYSEKYLGHILQKGQLTLDLEYNVLDNKLQGKNRVYLDQFTLGDKVDSPDAISLPVKLGIALLKDRNGLIELDLPVSGDLNNPEFKISQIIVKMILNLLTKIITAPFAALSSIFGGGAELSFVDFEYGSSQITAPMQAQLDKLTTALYDRPALQLEIQGDFHLKNDRSALRQVEFDNLLKAQKLKEMVKKGRDAVALAEVKIEPENYETYLNMAYQASEIPKPRDESGKIKKLPAAEMEKLLFTAIDISDEDLRLLAHERAAAVKEYILSSAKIEGHRLFILEPRSLASDDKKEENQSRVIFFLK